MTGRSWWRLRALAAIGVGLGLLSAGGCGSRDAADAPAQQPAPVALIGWDAATWDVIDPLLRQGRLPHLARLLDDGSRAVLLAAEPIYSPIVWTTLATGFPAPDHGITGFQLPDPGGSGNVLAATFHRRRAPLWQMASVWGRTVGIVGWWTTWPAEPVNGFMVSDHLAYNRWDSWARRPEGTDYHLTFPAGLAAELAPLAVRPEQLDAATLTAIVPFNEAEIAEMMAADKPVMFHGPSVFRYGYSTDASNLAFAKHLLRAQGQPDLFSVVFILSDVAGHVFWHHYEPEKYRGVGDDRHLAQAIPNVYEQLDRWTGELLDELDPATRVIVLSDHGMGASASGLPPRPGHSPGGDHRPEGIFVVSGAGVPRGGDLGTLQGIDLAPTVLALLGLPPARDMPGRAAPALAGIVPLEDAADVATYGDGRPENMPEIDSPSSAEYEERLRSLGYIQ